MKKWTDERIRDTYAKHARISKTEAAEGVEDLREAIEHGGRSVARWVEILERCGWGPSWDDDDRHSMKTLRRYARLMRAFGHKGPFKWRCEACGTMVEVKP